MKLKELIDKIDKSNPKLQTDPSYSELGNIFNLDLYWSNIEDERLKCYWMMCWLCTDSWVGWRAYFLDDELVCVSFQLGRKQDEEFEFVQDKIETLKKYLESLVDNPLRDDYELIDFDQEIGENYKITYQSQLISIFHEKGIYQGEEVEVKRIKDTKEWNPDIVMIKKPDGTMSQISVRDIQFEYCKTF